MRRDRGGKGSFKNSLEGPSSGHPIIWEPRPLAGLGEWESLDAHALHN